MKALTRARKNGLEALVRSNDWGEISNVTNVEVGYVYWQTANWLLEQGYAIHVGQTGSRYLRLSDRGRALARSEGLLR